VRPLLSLALSGLLSLPAQAGPPQETPPQENDPVQTVDPGATGFLSTCTGTSSITNALLQSQTFAAAVWTKDHAGNAAAPAVAANSAMAPDGTRTASTLALPAVSSAASASFIAQATASFADWPYMADIYVKGAAGGEVLWIAASATGAPGSFSETKVVATPSWRRVALPWKNKTAGQKIEIGVDLRDGAQSAQRAQSVFLWGAQLVQGTYSEWSYIPTTTAAVAGLQTVNCPAHVAFRDFSALTEYSGNPIIPQDSAAYNAGGVSGPYMRAWSAIDGVYYGLANCTPSGQYRGRWPTQCLYYGSLTNWTNYAGNPVIAATPGAWDDHYLLHGTISPNCRLAAWCYYYSAMDAGNNSRIGIATSPDLRNWTKYRGNPLSISAYKASEPSLPTMIQIGNLLYMYTSVHNNDGTWIAIWTSRVTDGIKWTYAGAALNQPVPGDWDFANFYSYLDPFVFRNRHGFYEMAYTTLFNGATVQSVGYAVSADGLTWFKYGHAPILTQFTKGYGGITHVGDAVMVEDGTTFSMLYNYDDGVSRSNGMLSQMPDY